MRATLCALLPFALLTAGSLHIHPDVTVLSRAELDSGDDLDRWLAVAQREPPEALKPCPVPCSETGNVTSRAEWFLYPDPDKLAACNETMLLDMVVKTNEGKDVPTVVRACTADYSTGLKPAFISDENKASLCTTANRVLEDASIYMHHPTVEHSDEFAVSHLIAAGSQAHNHLSLQKPSCTENAMEFAYSQSAALGLFVGAELHQHGIAREVLEKLLAHAQSTALSKTTVFQLCAGNGRGADYSVGVVATSSKNMDFIRKTVKTWADGDCVSEANTGEEWTTVTIRVPGAVENLPRTNGTDPIARASATASQFGERSHSSAHLVKRSLSDTHSHARHYLAARADCRTVTVSDGDGCYAVAQRCGVDQTQLITYNRANICQTLVAGEKVCCTSGTLPSTLPPGNSDGTCKLRTVVAGDDCGSLASKCGISGADFEKINTKTNLCSTLAEGQQVCCSSGKRPDLKPKPDPSGGCATYTTKQGDYCAKIAAARDLTIKELSDFNKQTWGWNGCDDDVPLYSNFLMCVSSGSPPMPAPVANAVCGPTMPNTPTPPAGTNLTLLNPCPLNVCCNVWGQCGMTDDFCVISKSNTGAPGTSAPGKNGCVSNCGRDIIKGSPPANKIKVAYFESWNSARPCLHMDVDQTPSDYTHIHFSFANVTRTFMPEISDPEAMRQFELMKGMTGVKKIISFGGWAFSTEPGTFNILREAVLPANRETFKNNIIAFMNEHELDGVDLDWEYPGAPDIPEIPSGDPVAGLNYYRLLASIKSAVGSSKSVSFAAPASYWYLKAFPIKQMAKDLDYIIYMTYDLHGQWDYGSMWSSPGCATGNCLRSHVNETETRDALSMITKAGAASNKVVVGVASYGRSFKMERAGCDGVNCKFTGSPRVSNALPGRCTGEGGYIANAEIQEILDSGRVNRQWTEEGSNIFVYDDTEWVAYMDDEMKSKRSAFYDSYNFAGITDWAVDLQEWWDGSGGYDDEEMEVDSSYWSACTGRFTTLEALESQKSKVAEHCMDKYLVDVQAAVLDASLQKYENLLNNGYDKKFEVYSKAISEQVPSLINDFMYSDKVDKYFKCTEVVAVTCCSGCRYCVGGVCTPGADCKNGRQSVAMDKCPKMYPRSYGWTGDPIPEATFELVDAEGFYSDILEEYGIEEDWIKLDRRHMATNNGCQTSGKDVLTCIEERNDYWYNFPITNREKVKPLNPKNIIGESLPKARTMRDRIKTMAIASQLDEQVSIAEVVDATSIPAYATEEAIKSMEKVVEIANEIEKREREAAIIDFITGILFFLPVIGQTAGTVLTGSRTFLRILAGAGDVALTLYDVVENPDNAMLAIFGFLGGAVMSRSGFQNAAQTRRDMISRDLQPLGNVKVKLDKVDTLRGTLC